MSACSDIAVLKRRNTHVPDVPLELVSHMPERGVIFSDGMEADFLEFTSGTRAAIAPAEKKGHLVI